MTLRTSAAPHRLLLADGEFAQLVDTLDLDLPPQWRPRAGRSGTALSAQHRASLLERKILVPAPDLPEGGVRVHPSVAANLEVLAHPQAMLTTTAHIGTSASKSLHAVAGFFGSSLFQLDEGRVELSFFQATGLGKELARAVPPEPDLGPGVSELAGGGRCDPLAGTLPLRALEEVGLAVTLRAADPPGVGVVVEELRLDPQQQRLVRRVADETDGLLICDMLGRGATGPAVDRAVWLHAAGGWVGLRPAPTDEERTVRLVPVERSALGAWAAAFLSLVLS